MIKISTIATGSKKEELIKTLKIGKITLIKSYHGRTVAEEVTRDLPENYELKNKNHFLTIIDNKLLEVFSIGKYAIAFR